MTLPRVLLVDDTELFLELERGFLNESPVEVLLARSGQEALAVMLERRPDLVYLDFNLPGMSGAELCKQIKNDQALASVPVIMIIGNGKTEDRAGSLGAGCDQVLSKPLDRREFLEAGRSFCTVIDRRERRYPCKAMVIFRGDHHASYGSCLDVSSKGLYISARCRVMVGERLAINLVLPGVQSGLVEAVGRVAWLNDGVRRKAGNFPEGFGVELVELGSESRTLLGRYLDDLCSGPKPGHGR